MYASIMLYALMLAAVLLSQKSTKNITQKLGFAETNMQKALATGVLYAGAMLVISAAIGAFFYSLGMESDVAKVPETIKSAGAFQILAVVVMGSIVEEIFFRGYLQRKTNIIFASFIFAYFHIIYGSIAEMIGAFFLGAVLGVAYSRSKNLIVPSTAHLAYNLVLVMLIFSA
ncbi:MAG: CPBP family intramembrane glutamic endopeptidase [archaeon]